MPLVSKKDLENSYTSIDGSIFIDFEKVDKELLEENNDEDNEEEEED